ncbi:MAG TPA: U32 family peptidase [Candidatus Lokiarchaeia archaeon]|nr:U32 family peptidase [Candidatus Lokiarchaeia archaeon]
MQGKRLSVAYNWDPAMIEEIVKNDYPVKDLYASAQQTFIGGGRPSSVLPETTEATIKDQIRQMHDNNIEFTYTLNAPCMGGQEYLPKEHARMIKELQWIANIGCDGVVLTIPYLMEIVKKQFPQLKIRVSTIAKVNTVNKAKYFEAMGVNSITPDVMINRNFKILEKMVKATNCEINLLVTDGCLYECPYRLYHYNLCGHASQLNSNPDAYYDYPVIGCSLEKLSKPAEVMKCRWVRPEDLNEYEAIGINSFKIGGRRLTTEKIMESVKAYSDEKYEGNLADIVEGFTFATGGVKDDPVPDQADVQGSERKPKIYIDNTKLDGFINFFKTQDCAANCDECSYCEEWGKKAVTTSKISADVFSIYLESLHERLVTSQLFSTEKHGREAGRKKRRGN